MTVTLLAELVSTVKSVLMVRLTSGGPVVELTASSLGCVPPRREVMVKVAAAWPSPPRLT